MGLRRSIALGIAAFSFAGLSMYSSPVRAEEGELAAQDANAHINLRSLANTQADIVVAGKVGDRVQILSTSKTNDGVVWYRVKMLKSGQLGWVRSDLIKVSGKPKTAATPTPTPKGTAVSKNSAAKSTTPVPLTPPKSSATPQKVPVSAAVPKPTEPKKTAVAAPKATENSPSTEQTTASQAVIVSFQTPTYAVRIFSEAGHLRLNLFNRKSQQLALDAVPVESKNFSENTTYSYSSDLKVTVVVPTQGTPSLTTVALGNTLQEQQETTSTSPVGPEEAAKQKMAE